MTFFAVHIFISYRYMTTSNITWTHLNTYTVYIDKYTRQEIAVEWRKWLDDPLVQISPKIKLARYTITGIETRKDIINYGIGGEGRWGNMQGCPYYSRHSSRLISNRNLVAPLFPLISIICRFIASRSSES
jgi:hypothetical protein